MRKSDSADNQQERRTLTTYEAYLLGVHLTDGCTYFRKSNGGYSAQLSVKDRDFAEMWADQVKLFTGLRPKPRLTKPRKQDGRRYWVAKAYRKSLYSFLNELTANKTKIPPEIWEAPNSAKWAFVRGMMDGDGWAAQGKRGNGRYAYQVGFANTERWMVAGLHRLLRLLGVKVNSVRAAKPAPNSRKGQYWTMLVNMRSLIDVGFEFSIARKNNRLILYQLGLFKVVSPETIRQTLVNAKEDMVRSGRRLSELSRNDLAAYLPSK